MNTARIVFDLDGTLIDSAPDIHQAANKVLAAEGYAEITLAESRGFVGHGAGIFIERMRQGVGIPDSAHERLLAAFIELYEDAVHLTLPYPGAVAALQTLFDGGANLGICTNKPLRPAQAVLSHLSLDGYFATVMGGDSLAVRKPDPLLLTTTLDALGSGPAIYVGDSEVDAETADRAGVPFLLFSEGYRKAPIESLPHRASFARFDELPGLIRTVLEEG